MITTTQILFHSPAGVTEKPHPEHPLKPVVRVAFPHSSRPAPGGEYFEWGGDDKRTALALIDTGADNCCIDADLAQYLKLPRATDKAIMSWGTSGATQTTDALVQVIMTDSNHALRVPAVRQNLRGQAFSFMIGMSVLRTGRLLMDFDKSRFEFRKL